MTIAQSARKGLKSREEREELERVIAERMARYGASSQHIAQRQVSVLTSRFVMPNPESDYETVRRYGDMRAATGEALDERMSLFEEVACDVFERVYADTERAASRRYRARQLLGVYLAESRADVSLPPRVASHRRHALVPHGMLRRVSGRANGGRARSAPPSTRCRSQSGASISSTPNFLSLHFDLFGEEPDNFVTSTLFADGFIKYSAYPQTEFERNGGQRPQGSGDRRIHSARFAAGDDAAPRAAAVRHVALQARALHDPRFDRRFRHLDLRASRARFRARESDR